MKIYSKLLLSFIFIYFISCAGSPLKTSKDAEGNTINMMDVKIGMTKEEVLKILDDPYKTETKEKGKTTYDIWFYVTKGKELGQTRLINDNFTPFIFENNKIIGWGWKYYRYFFNVDNVKEKYEYEKSQKYTDDRDEWPPNQHTIITPKGDSKDFTERKENGIKKTPENDQKDVKNEIKDKKEEKGTKVKEETPKEPKKTEEKQIKEEKIPPCREIERDHENYHWWE